MKKMSNLIYKNNFLVLAILGLVLFCFAVILNSWLGPGLLDMKTLLVNVIANLGALILVVGILQWRFDYHMREDMIHEIIQNISANARIYNNGITDCHEKSVAIYTDGSLLKECREAKELIIGLHYDIGFFQNFGEVFEERRKVSLETTILISDIDGLGIEYLTQNDSTVEKEKIKESIDRIHEFFCSANNIKLHQHPILLRYLFISTEKSISIVPMLNSKGNSQIPVLKIRQDSPLHKIFYADVKRLLEQSEKVNNLK